jgi:hypothetical protein
MLPEDIAAAQTFVSQWGKQPSETVEWYIQRDDEHLDWGTPNIDEHHPTN